MSFVFLFVLSIIGSLLFLREIEINRNLQEKILELQLKDKLNKLVLKQTVNTPPIKTTATSEVVAPVESTVTPEISAPVVTAAAQTKNPKIGEILVEREEKSCLVRVSLVPNKAGLSDGYLLVILETEVPKIGTHTAQTQIRKRFYFYPSGKNQDDFDMKSVQGLEKKYFQFSKVLQTQISFNIGKFIKPIAANIYLYNQDKTLVQHIRKQIEVME